jgi:extracellular factor (EF) 3-hydroxypalmitic acid methyl ester biosynthesis protein
MQNAVNYDKTVTESAGQVQESQKQYGAILSAETEAYLRKLTDFEKRCIQPDVDKEKLQAEITVLNETMLQACATYEQNVKDPFLVKAMQVEFREKTNPVLSRSYSINRTRNWPQGHQGDFYTLELAYRNAPMSEGMGYYLDKYVLSTALAEGVRERITKLRELLREELISRRNMKVLDLACGSCREVFELAPEIKTSGAKFTCVDLDEDALSYALDRFELAGLTEDQVELRKYNALRIFDQESALAEFGMQDIIYSVGYFDYLPDDFLIKLLSSLYDLLNPGGKLIAAFKDANQYRSQVYHWLINWDGFLQRTEDDFERILHFSKIPTDAASMTRVDSGAIVFYTIKK